MSKYSNTYDFRDVLGGDFKGFEDFKQRTQGIIYQWDNNGQLEICHIKSPADLVKYYSCGVECIEHIPNSKDVNIYLGNPPKIQLWLENTPLTKNGFDPQDIEYIREQSGVPGSGFFPNDPKLIGAYMVAHLTVVGKREII